MIIIYVLSGCPYCEHALSLLHKYKIKHKRIIVSPDQKDKIKKTFKQQTFPIILLKSVKKTILIGGASDLENYIQQYKKQSDKSIEIYKYLSKYIK